MNSARNRLLQVHTHAGKDLSCASLPHNPKSASHCVREVRGDFTPGTRGWATTQVISSCLMAHAGNCWAMIDLKSSRMTGSVLVNLGLLWVNPPSAMK